MKILVLWSNKPFRDLKEDKIKETLFYYLIKKNQKNDHFSSFFEEASPASLEIQLSSIKIINDENIIEIIDKGNTITKSFAFEDFDALFILAELDWHGHKLTDFYGITIARKLRLKNIKCPIFICSFMPEEYLTTKGQYKILGFRSHYFLHLPKGFEEDIEVTPLDDMELLDCKMHYCGIEGAIREIYHRKQHILPEDDFNKAKKHILELLEEINKLADLPEYLKPEIDKLIVEVQGKEDIKELKIFCKSDESRILAHLKDQDKDDSSKQVFDDIKGHWKILILEDVRKDIDSLFDSLKLAGIKEENILHAISFDEAKEIIENDKGNKISVVICDYRLEKDGKQKGRQGYSFVEWLSKQDRYNEIFVYSGLARRFLKETFKSYNIRVTVNSKYDITDRMGDFVDEVVEKGNEIAELINNRPTSEAWREMELFYQHYRQWPGYDNMEREISEVSRNIINQIKYLRETIEKYDLKEKISFSQIPTLPNLAGRLFKDFEKSQIFVNPKLISNYSKENIKLYQIKGKKDNKTEQETYKEVYYCFPPVTDDRYRENYFKNKLIARRIAWWLLMCEGIHLNTVYSLLSKGEYINYYFRKTENYDEFQSSLENDIPETIDAKTLINTRLAVIKEDFPYRLLVEEKNWFKYEMGVDLNDLMSIICGFENYFDELFESFKAKMNHKREEYSELEKTFIINGKFLFHTANDIRKALELSIKSLENTNDKRDLIYNVINRFDENDMICKSYFDKLKNYGLNQIKNLKNK
jgi:hypothetical protein